MLRKLPGIDLLPLRPTSPTQQLSWSSSSMWRGSQGRATTWLHTRVGCTQLRLGTPPLSSPQPVNLNCSLLWSRCLAASEPSVAQHTLEGSVSSSRRMCSLGTLGPTTMNIRRRWIFFWQPMGAQRLPMTLCPKTLYGLQLRCAAGDAVQLGMGELFETWHDWEQCFPEKGSRNVHQTPTS